VQSRGPHRLIKEGATLVESAADVIEALNNRALPFESTVAKQSAQNGSNAPGRSCRAPTFPPTKTASGFSLKPKRVMPTKSRKAHKWEPHRPEARNVARTQRFRPPFARRNVCEEFMSTVEFDVSSSLCLNHLSL
jgi:predicted Rossmann fold nucleotide-binding protein DprA/Smf involved in DNA uptake